MDFKVQFTVILDATSSDQAYNIAVEIQKVLMGMAEVEAVYLEEVKEENAKHL